MKIIGGDVFLYQPILKILDDLGVDHSGSRQFQVDCKCRGYKDANTLCDELGHNIFNSTYASVRQTPVVVKYFEEHPEMSYVIRVRKNEEQILADDLQIKEKLREYKKVDVIKEEVQKVLQELWNRLGGVNVVTDATIKCIARKYGVEIKEN